MKKDWQIKTLADVCTFENGDRGVNYPSKVKRTSVGIPFINAGHFVDNKIDLTNMDYISRERYNLMGRGKIQKGDILFCLRGSLGKFASVGDLPEGQIASSLVIVRPSELVLHEYLLAYFESHLCEENIEHFRGGAAQPNLAAKSLTQFTIPIPPIPEQQRIVALLDEAFAGLAQVHANAERNRVNAREVFEAMLQEIFENGKEWETTRLEECFRLKSGDALTSKEMNNGGEFPVYGGNGIAGMHDSHNLSGDNIIIGRVGALCGNARHITEKIWLTDNAFKLVDFNYEFDNAFLTYLLNYKKLRKFARQAAQPVISNSSLKDIPLHFPKSLAEQRVLVKRLDGLAAETSRLEGVYKQKIDAVEELRKSLLRKAFEGEL